MIHCRGPLANLQMRTGFLWCEGQNADGANTRPWDDAGQLACPENLERGLLSCLISVSRSRGHFEVSLGNSAK